MAKRSQDPYYHEMGVLYGNHAISKLNFISTSTGEKFEYYFDLTWDLKYEQSIYFALNKSQMSNDHQFTIEDGSNFSNVSPDLQPVLYYKGLLETSARNKEVQADLQQRAQDYSADMQCLQ